MSLELLLDAAKFLEQQEKGELKRSCPGGGWDITGHNPQHTGKCVFTSYFTALAKCFLDILHRIPISRPLNEVSTRV